ncbi:hypothetical protein GCM10011577_26940 [Pseudarthrobacter polychromogenes]|uniref:Uncharacterized protein n=1 Tax=Pseudarthrobacter polychromogenes TaxID=1676 RepID=A0ABQ1XRY4_9MICC|nr:hypothetical protein GCM10011577_26940 [Pseudarthrobacter polychromogenes]
MLLLVYYKGIRACMAQCAPDDFPTAEMRGQPAAKRSPQPICEFRSHHLGPRAVIDFCVKRQPL